jgi:hypothetical protein
LHSKSAASPALNVKVASVLFVRAAGPLSTRAAGASVSTIHEQDRRDGESHDPEHEMEAAKVPTSDGPGP